MRDDDHLRLLPELTQQVREALHVCAVEGGIDFVENAEGAGLDVEKREQQGGGRQGTLAAGEQRQRLPLLAGDLDQNVDACFQNVVGGSQLQLRFAAAEEAREDGFERSTDRVERLQKDPARAFVDLRDRGQQLGTGLFQIGSLSQQELVPGPDFFVLINCRRVDVPDEPQLPAQTDHLLRRPLPDLWVIFEAQCRLK